MANHRRIDLLLNQVISQQHINPGLLVIEDIQIVFTVGCRQTLLKNHILQLVIKCLVFTRLQVVTIGKNQPVIVREQDTGVFNRINALRLLDLVVVDNVTKLFFLVGSDLQDDDITD